MAQVTTLLTRAGVETRSHGAVMLYSCAGYSAVSLYGLMLYRIDRVSTLRCQAVADAVVWAMNCRQFICTCSPVSTLSIHPQIPPAFQKKPYEVFGSTL